MKFSAAGQSATGHSVVMHAFTLSSKIGLRQGQSIPRLTQSLDLAMQSTTQVGMLGGKTVPVAMEMSERRVVEVSCMVFRRLSEG